MLAGRDYRTWRNESTCQLFRCSPGYPNFWKLYQISPSNYVMQDVLARRQNTLNVREVSSNPSLIIFYPDTYAAWEMTNILCSTRQVLVATSCHGRVEAPS